MFKKLALGVACLSLLLGTVGTGFASQSGHHGGSGCDGDMCGVNNPTKIEVGYDLRVDLDVCIDAGNLVSDSWSVQAIIYQDGQGNIAGIEQADTSDRAGIIQEGNWNKADINQWGANEYALILQTPEASFNYAQINQSADGAAATIIQAGCWNSAKISQY